MHAEPTTLGLKFALWYAEMQRNLERMEHAHKITMLFNERQKQILGQIDDLRDDLRNTLG